MKQAATTQPSVYATAAELAGLPGLPGSERRVRDAVSRLGIPARRKSGKGGGVEYLVDHLPAQARDAFLRRQNGIETEDKHGDWVTAAELASLPGFPESEFRAREAAKRLQLPTRIRQGLGGGEEFFVDALPRAAMLALRTRRGLAACRQATESNPPIPASAPQAARVTGWQKQRQDSAAQILVIFRRFHAGLGGALTPAFRAFAAAWSQGRIEADESLRQRHPSLSWSTLRNWYLAMQDRGLAGITPPEHHRKGQYQALAGEVGNAMLAMLVDKPHLSAQAIYEALSTQFKGLPSDRAFRRALAYWKEQNAQVLEAAINPDGWRNKYMSAAGSYSEGIVRPNQKWEMDSTVGDVMLNDGRRHHIVGVIDVYTRRRLFIVTRTSRANAIMSLIRLAIQAWGVPESIKTDNGADYTAQVLESALLGLSIDHPLCAPFAPHQKPHIERAIGALMHQLFELLDGYIGHSVAERKGIEARQGFAKRIMRDKDFSLEMRLTPEQLQASIDSYCERRLHEARGYLGNRSPAQMAAGHQIKTVSERALDVLLAPAVKHGTALIRKEGIRVMGGWYNHASIGGMEGQRVQIRVDESNLGRCWVFDLDGTFVCEALDHQRLGISAAEVAAERSARQRRVIREHKQVLRNAKREFDTAAAIDAIHSTRTAEAVAEASNVISILRTAEHTSVSIASIDAAGTPVVDEVQIAAAQAALAQRQVAPAKVMSLPDSPQTRYARWLKLQQRIERGEALAGDERNWFEGYAHGPEWASMQRYFSNFGLDADQVLAG